MNDRTLGFRNAHKREDSLMDGLFDNMPSKQFLGNSFNPFIMDSTQNQENANQSNMRSQPVY